MRIAHFLQARLPVQGYGGTERVVWWLAKAQAEAGHDVTFICKAGSHAPFARCVTYEPGFRDLTPFVPAGTDIVHLRGTPQFKLDLPFVVSIDGNGQAGERFHPNSVFVSRNHAERHGHRHFVHNGLDPDDYPLHAGARAGGLLFLAKAAWKVKNLKGALKIARRAGKKLHIAGGRAPFWQWHAVSHGMVDGAEKLRLLRDCEALLFPVLWDEPFGVAVIEALASGMPVLGTRRGSLPEILTARCGVLADTLEEQVDALATLRTLKAEDCRARVLDAFTHRHMATAFDAIYRKILSDGALP